MLLLSYRRPFRMLRTAPRPACLVVKNSYVGICDWRDTFFCLKGLLGKGEELGSEKQFRP